MESIQQTFNGTTGFGNTVTATISRNGDLVGRMYLEHEAEFKTDAVAGAIGLLAQYGSRLIKECEIEIGGQRIDRHYGHWLSAYTQLTELNPTAGDTTLFNKMSGNGEGFQSAAALEAGGATPARAPWTVDDATGNVDTVGGKMFIPLQFWFCRNAGLALPLIALQYHEVKVKMTFEQQTNLVRKGTDADNSFDFDEEALSTAAKESFNLWADYIYLDTDERRRFAQVSHEYLIEQVQHENHSSGGTMSLNFNHPVKELVWAREALAVPANGDVTDLATLKKTGAEVAFTNADWLLKLNGHDRFAARPTKYFTRTQVWQHHTGCGGVVVPDSIGVYSFALKPEEHQPSGTCNFSRIDNAQLVGPAVGMNVYAVNYNVLRIMSGMGGLAYSN
tara:strand:+ start:34 stop:1206 length:1173 start_codon:yes stop_codon:yes gene_type:complete